MTATRLSLIKSSRRRLVAWVVTTAFVLLTCTVFAQASPPSKEPKKGSPKQGADTTAEKRAKAKKDAEERRKRRRPPQANKNKKEGKKPAAGKKEKKDEQAADPEIGEVVPEHIEIDAGLRKRIDDLLKTEEDMSTPPTAGGTPKSAGRRRSRGRTKTPVSSSTPGGTPRSANPSRSHPDRRSKDVSGEVASGPTTTLNIPAALEFIRPEDRTYFFSIVDGTYAQLIEGIARETGLGVIGEAPSHGKVSFICEEELSFEALLRKVRVLLFNYKPLDPYTLVRHDTHLQVIRVTDYYRELPVSRMYQSRERFRAAELTPDELVLVVYTPESGSVADLKTVIDFMPDYVRVTPLEDSNSVTIFARVMDIEKYFEVMEKILPTKSDPRTLKLIPVKYISASEAVERLGSLMELDGAPLSSRRRAHTSKGRSLVGTSTVAEPEVTIVPDDAQRVIIVRAMPAKIAEIEMLLPFFDVGQASAYDPVVIEVVHADPAELVTTIQQILDTGVGTGSSSRKSASSKRISARKKAPTRGGSKNLSATTFSNITMIPHPVTNAIIVMADEEKLATVRAWVERLDVPSGVANVPVALTHIDADSAVGMITELLDAGASPQGAGPVAEVIAAPSGNALWYTGSERDLTRVRELVAVIDTPDEVVSLHIVTLRNQSATFVANILRQYANEGGITPTAKPKKSPGGKRDKSRARARASRSSSSSTGKFTADDDLGRLYILCSQREWMVYQPLIDQLESASPSSDFVILTVEHISADEAVDKIKSMLSAAQVDKIRFETTEGQIFITSASEQDLATIRLLLKEFDIAVETVSHTFEIKYAEPSELVGAIQTLFAEGGGAGKPTTKSTGSRGRKSKGGAKGSSTPSITIVQLGQFLIVETTPDKMEQIAEFLTEFDVDDDQREVRVYEDFPPGTDLDQMATDLKALLSGASPKGSRGPKKPAAGGSGAAAPRIVARHETRKMVIFAEADAFEEIEKFLEILRPDSTQEPVVYEFITVQHAEPAEIIELVQPLLDLQIEQFILRGELPEVGPLVSSPSPKGKKTRRPGSVRSATSGHGYHLSVDERMGRVMVAGPQLIVDATKDLIAQFDIPVDPADRMELAFLKVENTEPAELVELIEPFLSLKVDELIAAGALAGTQVTAMPSTSRAKPGPTKVATPRSRGSGVAKAYHLTADAGNMRLVVLAPIVVIEEARKLVEQFDVIGTETEIVFRTVELHKAAPSDMVKAIKEIMDVTGRAPGRRKGKSKLPFGTKGMLGISSTDKLVVAEAPGGTALILYGPSEDVAQAEEYIVKLDITPEREIKVYEIKHADLKKLVSLIMNDVDTPAPGAPRKGARSQPKKKQLDDEDDMFTTEIERIGTNVYIQADLIAKTMVVSAPASKISRIDGIVAELDREDALIQTPSMPKLFYTLKYTEAFDASFDLEMVLEALWEPPNQLPKVAHAPFGEVLIIKYPDESRFDEIEKLIRKYVDKPDPEDLLTDTVPIQLPPKGTPDNFIKWLKLKLPELDISVIDISTVEDPTHGVVELRPYNEQANSRQRPSPCVVPAAYGRMAAAVLASVTAAGGQTPDNSSSSDADTGSQDDANAKGKPTASKEELPGNVKSFLAELEVDASFDAAQEVSNKLKAFYDPNTGDLII
ncbi:MAG: hypothetical protein IH987_12710, partial [Planctomycetes bacterium]|nr:hypothetical protein [Planctomycetota bacterium]